MRFLPISAALIMRTIAAPACTTTGNGSFMETGGDWYSALIYCAENVQSPHDNADVFYTCLNGLDGLNDTPDTTMAGSLIAGLNVANRSDIVSNCHKCAFDFAVAAYDVLQEYPALAGSCKISGVLTAEGAKESSCQWGFYDAINAFNSCSGNGYDIVHKALSTRCTSDEFIDFAIAHNPLSPITQCVYENSALTSVSAISKCVGPSFIADKANLGCKSCFDPLITGIRDSDLTSCVHGTTGEYDYGHNCATAIKTHTDAFGVCTGGLAFYRLRRENHCSAEQKRVITAMRPYTNAMKCGIIDGEEVCLAYHNSIKAALDLLNDDEVCSEYVENIAYDLYYSNESKDACRGDFFGTSCTDYITNLYRVLYDAQVSIGMKLDVTSTKCSTVQWNAIGASSKSYVPFVRCAMKSSSITAVLDCIEEDGLMASVLESVACASCFKHLALEAYIARSNDASKLTEVACIDPYTQGCLDALAKPMSIFKDCSGFDSKIISNAECSSVPAEAGLSAVVALVANSLTSTEAIFKYSEIADNLGLQELPCAYCHLDLIVPLFSLSDINKAICIADIESWGCYMALGTHLDNFYRCSRGWLSNADTSTPRESYGGLQ